MRRKLLALNLAIVMILMLLPIKALAVNTTLTAGQQTVISSNELYYKSQTFYYTPQESGTYDFVFSGITTFGDLILYDGSNAL